MIYKNLNICITYGHAKNPLLGLQIKLLSSNSTTLTPYFGQHTYKKHKPADCAADNYTCQSRD